MTTERIAAAAFLVVCLGVATRATAQDVDPKVESLKGLTGVGILVADLSEERDGLTKAAIRTDVELKLRLAGIRVLTRDEAFQAPGQPYLYVVVSTVRHRNAERYSYKVDLRLKQTVQSHVRPSVAIAGATTWDTGAVGYIGATHLPNVRGHVMDRVDWFIDAWFTANP